MRGLPRATKSQTAASVGDLVLTAEVCHWGDGLENSGFWGGSLLEIWEHCLGTWPRLNLLRSFSIINYIYILDLAHKMALPYIKCLISGVCVTWEECNNCHIHCSLAACGKTAINLLLYFRHTPNGEVWTDSCVNPESRVALKSTQTD